MKKVLLFIFQISVFLSFSQVGPGVWRDHLSMSHCNSVTKAGPKIYASYKNGLVRFYEDEMNLETLNKINGLSDVGINLLRTNPNNGKILVIYDNCNIDVIDANEKIKNYPDFKLKSLSGKKVVNEVSFYKQYAYLACGFGIVVFDTEKHEIKDTYIIGPSASNLEVFQVALNDSLIFAATTLGMYSCNFKTKILNNFNNWKRDTISLPKGVYSGVVNVAGQVLCCYSPGKLDPTKHDLDTFYVFTGNNWIKYPPMANSGSTAYKLYSFGNLFAYIDPIGVICRDINTGSLENYMSTFNGELNYGTTNDVLIAKDFSGNRSYWRADEKNGLSQTYGTYPYFKQNKINRNGTRSNTTSNIDVYNGVVAVSPSYINVAGTANAITDGINIYKNNEWNYLPTYDLNSNPLYDVTTVLIDRKDQTKMWVGSWLHGIMLYKNNKLVTVWNPTLTTGFSSVYPDDKPGEPRCTGLSQDKDGNTWFAHSDQPNYLGVIKANGQYQKFYFGNGLFSRKTFVDKNNYVWIVHDREGGLTVFNHNGFNAPNYEVNYRVLTKEVGKGNLESNSVYSIAEDKDGKIWIGTAAGIKVIYNPTNIFAKSADYDAQPIKIVQDGNVELLLGKEIVTAIAVDGANNKWVGTAQGGVYCFNPDGQKQLYHFTAETSPLYSNNIIDLNYDEKSGDVFIGTEIGIQSFRSTIIEGSEEFEEVIAYPNPVRPNYQGSVLVKGLIDDSVIKITDINGNMVWETKATGGQIEWPVAALSGKRVTSGVYVVYCSTSDGEQKALTKILVVN